MWKIETTFVTGYFEATSQAFEAFLPLWASTVGVFLAFAIANMVRFFLSRTIK